MKPHLMWKFLSLVTALALGILPACAPAAAPASGSSEASEAAASIPNAETASSSEEETVWDPVPQEIAELIDLDATAYLEIPDDRVTRDDLAVTAEIAPYKFRQILQALVGMDLRPWTPSDPELDVAAPFTLSFTYGGKEYHYAFSRENIKINGKAAYPQNPDALAALYEDDQDYGLLTQPVYYLRDDMDFTAADVAAAELRVSSMAGEDTLTFTGQEDIQNAMDTLGGLVVWRLPSDSPPNPKTGGASSCIFTLTDGTTWQYITSVPCAVDRQGNTILYQEISPNYDSLFAPVYSQPGVSLAVTLGGQDIPVYQTGMDYDGVTRSGSTGNGQPGGDVLLYETSPVIEPLGDTACTFAFSAAGSALTPESVSVSLWKENETTGAWESQDAPAVSGSSMQLPNTGGKYYVQLRAQLPDGWVEYLFQYRVTDLPAYFWDIEFGNGEGNVTFIRKDSGLSIPGGQNRQYVDFILSLGLTVQKDAPAQSLPVKNAFTMVFDRDGEQVAFDFSAEGIQKDGQPCAIAHPERIPDLYAGPETQDIPTYGDGLIDYGLRGFLSNEVTSFAKAYPAVTTLQSVEVRQERRQEYIAYDATAQLAGDLSWLDGIIIAREWPGDGYYAGRSFYLSYQLTLPDGTLYELRDQLLIDGEATGWYVVYGDLAKVQAAIEPLEGEIFTYREAISGVPLSPIEAG